MGTCSSNPSSPKSSCGKYCSNQDQKFTDTVISNRLVHHGSILGLSIMNGNLGIASDDKEISVHEISQLVAGVENGGLYLKGHEKAVNRLVFTQDGKLWSASRDLSLRMWDPIVGGNIATIPKAHSLNVSAIACPKTPCFANTLISGSRDYSVKNWDIETLQCLSDFRAPRNIVTALTCKSTDPHLIYQGSEDLCIRVWDIRQNTNVTAQHITGYVYFPLCLHLQDDGPILATGCKGFNSVGCGVTLWDTRNTSQPLNELRGHTQDVTSCQFHSVKSNMLVTASKDGSIYLWNMHSMKSVANYQFPKKWISSLVIYDHVESDEGIEIIVGALDGTVSMLKYSDEEGFKLMYTSLAFEYDDIESKDWSFIQKDA